MKKTFIVLLLALGGIAAAPAQTGFVILGDLHLDKFEFHDMEYVYTRPSDWRQVTREYPYFTAAYAPKLFAAVGRRIAEGRQAVVQLGDLMEGVAGSDSLAERMARYCVDQIDRAAGGVPVLLAKGNHDVSASPGQPEAWKRVVLPYVERQTGQRLANGMYRYTAGDADFFVAEQFFSPDEMLPETALLEFLRRELPRSKARYRFLVTHQPVIPVTERCWHLMSGIRREIEDPALREELLELLAAHRVTVLCAHLHKYSRCVRSTAAGNVVQLMVVSTVDSFDTDRRPCPSRAYLSPDEMRTDWQPHTLARRKALIAAEGPHVKLYSCCYLPGYATVDLTQEGARFAYYAGYADTPCETLLIDDLYKL